MLMPLCPVGTIRRERMESRHSGRQNLCAHKLVCCWMSGRAAGRALCVLYHPHRALFSAAFARINGLLFIDIFAAVWNLSSHVCRYWRSRAATGARGAAWEWDDAVCLRQERFGRARPVLAGKAKFSQRVSVPVSGVRKTECRVICHSPATQARRLQRVSRLAPVRMTQANRNKARLPSCSWGRHAPRPCGSAGGRHCRPCLRCKLRFPATQARRLLRVSRLAPVRTSDPSEPQTKRTCPLLVGQARATPTRQRWRSAPPTGRPVKLTLVSLYKCAADGIIGGRNALKGTAFAEAFP